jgi:diguanylate cyclase (GGDEF)-like protein
VEEAIEDLRVLVVAGPGPRSQIRRVIDRFDWSVRETSDPDEALRCCREEMPDVVLLDAGAIRPTAEMTLFEELRRDPKLEGLRIVVVSGELDLEQAVAGLDSGVDEYLVEPVRVADVATRLRTAAHVLRLERQLYEMQADLLALAHTDAVTGMYNRRYLSHQLVALINSAHRHGRALGLLVLDVDRFKQLNDEHGHAVGDAALLGVANLLRSRLRAEDVAGRWGGDEFVVVLPDTSAEGLLEVATTICEAADGPANIIPVGLSVGAASWSGEQAGEFFRRADHALLEAKRAGRGTVRVAPPHQADAATVGSGELRRVVVVDDSSAVRQLVTRWLHGTSAEVVGEAANGRDALLVVEDQRPDVVIMDLHMPVMDGLTCTRLLREQYPSIEVVAYTASEDEGARDALRDAGAQAHFNKGELDELTDYLTSARSERQ